MSFEIKNTSNKKGKHINMLIHSDGCINKLALLKTLPLEKVLVLNLEDGMLSLGEDKVDYVDLKNLLEVNKFLDGIDKKYEYVVMDTVTEASQIRYLDLKKQFPEDKDALKIWGTFLNDFSKLFRRMRRLDAHVIINAHTVMKDFRKDGIEKNSPGISGKSSQRIVDWFDEVFYLFRDKDDKLMFLTQETDRTVAKDRSEKLQKLEEANLFKVLSAANA